MFNILIVNIHSRFQQIIINDTNSPQNVQRGNNMQTLKVLLNSTCISEGVCLKSRNVKTLGWENNEQSHAIQRPSVWIVSSNRIVQGSCTGAEPLQVHTPATRCCNGIQHETFSHTVSDVRTQSFPNTSICRMRIHPKSHNNNNNKIENVHFKIRHIFFLSACDQSGCVIASDATEMIIVLYTFP